MESYNHFALELVVQSQVLEYSNSSIKKKSEFPIFEVNINLNIYF